MATDTELISDEFSDTACRLLKEYSAEIEKLRSDTIQVLDWYYMLERKPQKQESDYVKKRIQNNVDLVGSLTAAFETLVRKTSQWIQHANHASPAKQLELEVRLQQFQQRVDNIHRFFESNMI